MSLLRRASLSRKKNKEGDGTPESPRGPSIRHSKPPKSRSVSAVSDANSIASDADSTKPKRKLSLSRSKKKLSSLFSSSSLSSFDSPKKDPSSSPSLTRSTLSTSTTPPSVATPIEDRSRSSRKFPSIDGKGTPSSNHDIANGVSRLRLGSESIPLTDSPELSPTKAVHDGTAKPANGSAHLPELGVAEVEGTPRSGMPTRKRTPSMWSQWELEEAAEESSSDEDDEEAFLTPSEGLSEVEEEDEEEEGAQVDPALDRVNVAKGTVAATNNISGTGKSTIRRSKHKGGDTKVRKRQTTKGSALNVDQGAVLAGDIETCREVLTLFLTSKMREAEELCFEKDPEGNHMYLLSAHGIINGLKGMMTFDSHDLANALELCKSTATVASTVRKPADSIVTRIGGLVGTRAGVQRIHHMTPLERHAELVYAETTLMKAMLAIIAGGDWLGLVREALNMRTAHGIYRTLQQYLEDVDKHEFDEDVDMDFRSGVLLGTGTSSLMLSLLPGKVLKIAEVFGYAGNQKVALQTLMAAGGWSKDSDKPAYDEKNEGIRRPVCDIILLAFHLVISTFIPINNDVPLARNIVAYCMRRYPDGIFFLYFKARLHTAQCEPELANQSLQKALDLPLEYVQLQHMCMWDYALNNLMQGEYKSALDAYSILKDESNWSRAVYTYSAAACVLELTEDGYRNASVEEAEKLLKVVPTLTKKIAGKSLPIEKLVNRKARKFESQGKRLFLPAMELAYIYGGLSSSPKRLLVSKQLPRLNRHLAKLDGVKPEEYGNGAEYWDDYCLGHFLRGVVKAVARYQSKDAAPSASENVVNSPSDEELDKGAEEDMLSCLKNGDKVRLDHYILYHCHFELGKLYAHRKDKVKARENFNVVMAGKLPEVNQFEKKTHGKYSLEGALLLKTHAAIQTLDQ